MRSKQIQMQIQIGGILLIYCVFYIEMSPENSQGIRMKVEVFIGILVLWDETERFLHSLATGAVKQTKMLINKNAYHCTIHLQQSFIQHACGH